MGPFQEHTQEGKVLVCFYMLCAMNKTGDRSQSATPCLHNFGALRAKYTKQRELKQKEKRTFKKDSVRRFFCHNQPHSGERRKAPSTPTPHSFPELCSNVLWRFGAQGQTSSFCVLNPSRPKSWTGAWAELHWSNFAPCFGFCTRQRIGDLTVWSRWWTLSHFDLWRLGFTDSASLTKHKSRFAYSFSMARLVLNARTWYPDNCQAIATKKGKLLCK